MINTRDKSFDKRCGNLYKIFSQRIATVRQTPPPPPTAHIQNLRQIKTILSYINVNSEHTNGTQTHTNDVIIGV